MKRPRHIAVVACIAALAHFTALPAVATDLKSCIGMSPTGYLQCRVVPQIVGPWGYRLLGPPQATPIMSTERAPIELRASDWASVGGYTLCSGVVDTVGSYDSGWEDSLASNFRKYDYRTFNTYRRKPVVFNWSRKVSQPGPFECYPLSASDYLYSQRTVACAEGWYADESVETAFCARDEPVEDASCPVGNPVLPALGIKLHSETDYAGAGAHPLNFTRFYRSRWPAGLSERGNVWSHNWASEIAPVVGAPTRTVRTMRPDGSIRSFTQAAAAAGQPPAAWQADAGLHDQLTELLDINGRTTGWTLRAFADDSTETYDALGKLLNVRQRNGWKATLTYANPAVPGQLTSVSNHFGRQLRFVYDIAGRLSQLLPPGAVQDSGAGSAASPIRYSHQELASLGAGTPAAGQLTSVTWQDGAVKRYHYEDARFVQALTGLTDEAGVRIASYVYDPSGKVAEETKAGGTERLTFSYSTGSTQVTDYAANGTATVRAFSFSAAGGIARPTSLTSPCQQCGSAAANTTYGDGSATSGGAGALGQEVRSLGHDGSVTFYLYDAAGREVERAVFGNAYRFEAARPALTLATSVKSTKWHATWKLPTQVAEPGKVTAYTYDSKGNLTGQSWTGTTDATGAAKFAAVKTGSTYATGWGYNASVLNTSVVEKTNAVETGRWTLAYNAAGDATRVTDVTGGNRIGNGTQYDAQGRLLTGTTTLGQPVAYGYSSRGFVRTRSVGGQAMTFTQDAIGLTTNVLLPDNQTVRFEYDATHRLTAVRLNGALLVGNAKKDGTRGNATLAIARERLQRVVESMVRPAHAQVAVPVGAIGLGSVVPGMALPGQPGVTATSILTANDYPGERPGAGGLPVFGPGEEATRRLLQAITRFCQCDPSGGFGQPKLSAQALAHIVISGHTGPAFANKSYFTEPVNQMLVDEVVRKDTRPDVPGQNFRVYFVPDMGRSVGFSRRPDGTFVPERSVTLVVHKDNCNNLFYVRNEVITMHPGGR